jgi:hypothetical protein
MERKHFFLKKRNKKLLFTEAFGAVREKPQGNQKFFASFFQKRSAFLRFQIASYKNDGSAHFFKNKRFRTVKSTSRRKYSC